MEQINNAGKNRLWTGSAVQRFSSSDWNRLKNSTSGNG